MVSEYLTECEEEGVSLEDIGRLPIYAINNVHKFNHYVHSNGEPSDSDYKL